MQVKEDLVSMVRDALKELTDVSITRDRDNGNTTDVTVTTVDGQTYRLEMLWAGEGWPSDVRGVLAQVPEDEWPRHLAVVARSLSPGA